jgi:protein-tyrosine phosphatase
VLRDLCPPEHHGKLALFLGDRALPDPYYGEATDFEKVLDMVEKRADSLIAAWSRATD